MTRKNRRKYEKTSYCDSRNNNNHYLIFRNNREYIEEECPFSIGSTTIQNKHILNQMEHDRAGSKLAFYLKFLNAKPILFASENMQDLEDELFICPTCGQPTQNPGNCAFCRMITR